jgi:hypothetical protein
MSWRMVFTAAASPPRSIATRLVFALVQQSETYRARGMLSR